MIRIILLLNNLIMEDGSWKHFEFQSKNADIFLKELLEKKNAEKSITRGETAVTKEEIQKIEAVIYAMADKFLDGLDMEEFVEGMKMTRLGEIAYFKRTPGRG